MSADPSVPGNAGTQSGGYVIKNIMYNTNGGSDNVKVFGGKFQITGNVTAEQYMIPPSREDMPSAHPCAELNRTVLRCNEKLDSDMRLAGRCAACNEERKALMKCVTTHKTWEADQRKALRGGGKSSHDSSGGSNPWWKLW